MKAFDSVSWHFLSKLLQKFGFSHWFITLVMNNLKGAWFSVLVNGRTYGFFQSGRGVKQGDPLSPYLFLLVADSLSRGLNELLASTKISPFALSRGCFSITHLSFADDVLVFMRGLRSDIKEMLDFLAIYPGGTGKRVNKSKSSFLTSSKC